MCGQVDCGGFLGGCRKEIPSSCSGLGVRRITHARVPPEFNVSDGALVGFGLGAGHPCAKESWLPPLVRLGGRSSNPHRRHGRKPPIPSATFETVASVSVRHSPTRCICTGVSHDSALSGHVILPSLPEPPITSRIANSHRALQRGSVMFANTSRLAHLPSHTTSVQGDAYDDRTSARRPAMAAALPSSLRLSGFPHPSRLGVGGIAPQRGLPGYSVRPSFRGQHQHRAHGG